MSMRELDVALLRRLLAYDPETGELTWLKRTPDLFTETEARTAAHSCARWNSQHAGTPAFTATHNAGYRQGNIFGGHYLGHRVAYALHHGVWPDGQIDHINGVRTDNRIINLRVVDSHGLSPEDREILA